MVVGRNIPHHLKAVISLTSTLAFLWNILVYWDTDLHRHAEPLYSKRFWGKMGGANLDWGVIE